jgi:GNAT superfamily N-acetyltransferase
VAEITVRPSAEADAETLARIWVQNCRYYADLDPGAFQVPNEDGLVEWFLGFLREGPKENELSLVAELDGKVVGSIEASIREPMVDADRQMLRELGERRLFVNHVGVDLSHWRSGVGTELMRAAEEWAKKLGASISTLDTYVGSQVSVPFYEDRLSYKRHSIVFRKVL